MCHHSSILLPADTMTVYQTAGTCSHYQPRNCGFARTQRAQPLPKQWRGDCNMKQVKYKNGALMKTNISGKKNKTSRLERKSPGLRSFRLNGPWRWPSGLELPWQQHFPETSVACPPLASGPFLHPESSGSRWSTGWGDWGRNWRPPPVDTGGGGSKPGWKAPLNINFLSDK